MRTTSGTTLAAAFGILAVAIGASVGCGSNKGDGDANKTYFTDKVYPAIEPTCASCHSTGKSGAPVWLADNADGSYTAVQAMTGLIAPPSLSPLIQHGAHVGPALTDVQVSLVSQWLTMEAGPDTGNNLAPTDLRDAFKRFGTCMDYGAWTSLGLDNIAQTGTSDAAHCTSCHNEGLASVFLSDDPAATFMHFTEFPFVERLVTGTVNDQGLQPGLGLGAEEGQGLRADLLRDLVERRLPGTGSVSLAAGVVAAARADEVSCDRVRPGPEGALPRKRRQSPPEPLGKLREDLGRLAVVMQDGDEEAEDLRAVPLDRERGRARVVTALAEDARVGFELRARRLVHPAERTIRAAT